MLIKKAHRYHNEDGAVLEDIVNFVIGTHYEDDGDPMTTIEQKLVDAGLIEYDWPPSRATVDLSGKLFKSLPHKTKKRKSKAKK